MGKKIFVSYKYADDQVLKLDNIDSTTVRDYVTKFEEIVGDTDDIYKGESDDEDLSELEDDTIWEKLKDRIYDSSVTIVFISPGMKKSGVADRDQWIPWEVSYSLKETSRKNKSGDAVTSHTNAMLAVVLPDKKGSYSYYLEKKNCCSSGCVTHHTNKLFDIIKKNKFNRKNPDKSDCTNGLTIWHGEYSYIVATRWPDFIADYGKYVDQAVKRQDNIDDYKIVKEV